MTFGEGTYLVGPEISPGTYRNSDSSGGCYWARLSGFGGALKDIITNEFSYEAQIVSISPDDAGFETSRCGIWTRIGD